MQPKDSPIKLTPEQEAEVMQLTSVEQISQYMRDAALEQGLVNQLEGAHPGVLVDVPTSQRPPQVSAKIGDETFTGTAEQVQKAVSDFLTTKNAERVAAPNEPARDPQTGRYTNDQGRHDETEATHVAAAAELELRWKRGEITGAEYLEKSGAMDQYLAARGIDVAAHQAQLQDGQKYEQSWADAAKAWLGQHPDWEGGEVRKAEVAKRIQALGLDDSPSVDSINRAVAALYIEAEMNKENDPYKMEALKERWRQEVEGRFGGPTIR